MADLEDAEDLVLGSAAPGLPALARMSMEADSVTDRSRSSLTERDSVVSRGPLIVERVVDRA